MIHALDDPVVPSYAVPVDMLTRECPNTVVAFTKAGGHTGWLEGIAPFGLSFADTMCLEFMEAILRRRREEESIQGN